MRLIFTLLVSLVLLLFPSLNCGVKFRRTSIRSHVDAVRNSVSTAPLLATTFEHLGDGSDDSSFIDDVEEKEKRAFHVNLGRAIDAVQRGLPLVFVSDIDFSVFAPVVTVMANGVSLQVRKSFYVAGVRSFRLAALFSAVQPSVSLRKVEYMEAFRTIQCLVDVLLPDTMPLDGSNAGVWEGVFYFGLDKHGLIDSHILDRAIPPLRPEAPVGRDAAAQLQWLKAAPMCSVDLLSNESRRPTHPLL